MACRRSLALLLALIAPRARASGCTALPLSWSERDLTFSDGMVLLQHASLCLRHSFTSSGAVFLHLECDLPAHTHELKLGELRAHRLLACARTCRFWMGPTHCTHAASLPAYTQFLLVECRPGGPYALLLPLADASATLTLGRRGSSLALASPDALWARLDSAAACRSARALYVAASADPFELLRRAFSEVAARAGGFLPLRHKLLPPSADRFGWSTARPSPAGVMAGLRTLRDAAVPPRVLLLEEGWQTLTPLREPPPGRLFEWLLRLVQPHRDSPLAPLRRSPLAALWRAFLAALWRLLARGPLAPLLRELLAHTPAARQLDAFEPNERLENAAEGTSLRVLVSAAKQECGVESVIAAHPLHGHWRGVSQRLAERAQLRCHTLRCLRSPLEGSTPAVVLGLTLPHSAEALYAGMHGALARAGVDGVRLDGVSLGELPAGGAARLTARWLGAAEASAAARLGEGAASGGSHASAALLAQRRGTILLAAAGAARLAAPLHTRQIAAAAFNSLFLGEVCLPDWGAFASLHETAALHAAARAISGGPVYVSDQPGQHDIQLLRRLVLPDGSILRGAGVGRPTRDCLFADVLADGATPLKLWNFNRGGTGVLAAFHVQGVGWDWLRQDYVATVEGTPPPLSAITRPHDVEALRDVRAEFAVWRHRACRLEVLANGSSELQATLRHREWEFFTFAPIHRKGGVGWAALGLANMLNGGAAVLRDSLDVHKTWVRAEVVSRGPGTFVAYCDPAPHSVSVGGEETRFEHAASSSRLTVVLANFEQPHLVEVRWKTTADK